MFKITNQIDLADGEIQFSAVRAQGPGGQNVNKVSSAVSLQFDVRASSLPKRYKDGVLALHDRRISHKGIVTIKAQRFRSQGKNREDAVNRLRNLILRGVISKKSRIATIPSATARQRRIESKKRRSQIKIWRRQPSTTD